MELLIGLVVIIAVSELKEWRSERRQSEQAELIKGFQGQIDSIRTILGEQAKEIVHLNQNATALDGSFQEAKEFIHSANADLKQMLRDYELRVRRPDEREPDFVEGL